MSNYYDADGNIVNDEDRNVFKLTQKEWEQLMIELDKEPERVPGLVELFERAKKLKGKKKVRRIRLSLRRRYVNRRIANAYQRGAENTKNSLIELAEFEFDHCDCEIGLLHVIARMRQYR